MPKPAAPTKIKLDDLTLDPRLQPRVGLDDEVVCAYADAMQRGETFPPIRVIANHDQHWLVDGWHRVQAAMSLQRTELLVEVTSGTFEEAEDYVLTVNRTHGLRRSQGDVQNAIRRALKTQRWVTRSDNWTAKHIGCDQKTVTAQREQLESTSEIPKLKHLVGEDGKRRARPKPKPQPASTPTIDDPSLTRHQIFGDLTPTASLTTDDEPLDEPAPMALTRAHFVVIDAFDTCGLKNERIAELMGLPYRQVVAGSLESTDDDLRDAALMTEARRLIQLALENGATPVETEVVRQWLVQQTQQKSLAHREQSHAWSAIRRTVQNWSTEAVALPMPPQRPEDWTPYESERSDILAAIPVIETYLAALKASVREDEKS